MNRSRKVSAPGGRERRTGRRTTAEAGAPSRREVRVHGRPGGPEVRRDEIVSFALDVLARMNMEGEVGVRLCSERVMASFNRRFRGKRGATDVLSFPAGARDPEGGIYLGDLLIAVPVARRAAAEAGLPLMAEMKRLVLHGLIHLAGYDHETDGGTMARKERALRKEWGLP
jgi:probable rRNA maturation factor